MTDSTLCYTTARNAVVDTRRHTVKYLRLILRK